MAQGKQQLKFQRNSRIKYKDTCDTDGRRTASFDFMRLCWYSQAPRDYSSKTRGVNFNFPTKKGTGLESHLQHSSPECSELIYRMCAYDPDERISAKQAMRHAYFKDLRYRYIYCPNCRHCRIVAPS